MRNDPNVEYNKTLARGWPFLTLREKEVVDTNGITVRTTNGITSSLPRSSPPNSTRCLLSERESARK